MAISSIASISQSSFTGRFAFEKYTPLQKFSSIKFFSAVKTRSNLKEEHDEKRDYFQDKCIYDTKLEMKSSNHFNRIQNAVFNSSLSVALLIAAPASHAIMTPNQMLEISEAFIDSTSSKLINDLSTTSDSSDLINTPDLIESNEVKADVELEEEKSKAPEWLGSALLLFPLVTYAGFNVYREKLNPQATILDFVFLLVFLFIILNLVTSIALGVRLY